MRLLFLSPHYPPQYPLFCRALKAQGATVVGLGDAPWSHLPRFLRENLDAYRAVGSLEDRAAVGEIAQELHTKYGPFDAIESLNEHWLELESELREALGVPGRSASQLREMRRKSWLAEGLRTRGLPAPEGILVDTQASVDGFVRTHGFPLFAKPDTGVGAVGARRIDDATALQSVLAAPAGTMLLQECLQGRMVTWDGLVDAAGNLVFALSFAYESPIDRVVAEGREVVYWTRKTVPAALEHLGRELLSLFALRAGFFHAEFFEDPAGRFVPVELNLRPPGGFALDLMNYACDFDAYALWAAVLRGERLGGMHYEVKYHSAHVGRRRRRYVVERAAVPGFLGTRLCAVPDVPPGLRVMGDEIYLVRAREEASLLDSVRALLAVG